MAYSSLVCRFSFLTVSSTDSAPSLFCRQILSQVYYCFGWVIHLTFINRHRYIPCSRSRCRFLHWGHRPNGRYGSIIDLRRLVSSVNRNVGFDSNPSWVIGRFITGLGVGSLSMVVPLYNAEIAPPEVRGSLVGLQQLAITFGILISFWIDYGELSPSPKYPIYTITRHPLSTFGRDPDCFCRYELYRRDWGRAT